MGPQGGTAPAMQEPLTLKDSAFKVVKAFDVRFLSAVDVTDAQHQRNKMVLFECSWKRRTSFCKCRNLFNKPGFTKAHCYDLRKRETTAPLSALAFNWKTVCHPSSNVVMLHKLKFLKLAKRV